MAGMHGTIRVLANPSDGANGLSIPGLFTASVEKNKGFQGLDWFICLVVLLVMACRGTFDAVEATQRVHWQSGNGGVLWPGWESSIPGESNYYPIPL